MKLPSAEERAVKMWLWLSQHGHSKDYVLDQIRADRRAVLEAAAQIAPSSGDYAWVAEEIRKLKKKV